MGNTREFSIWQLIGCLEKMGKRLKWKDLKSHNPNIMMGKVIPMTALKELRARFMKKLEESQRMLMKALNDELIKVVEEIAREVAVASGDEELNQNDTNKGDDDQDEDEEEHDLHDREGGHDYMVEEVEDEGDRDGHGGNDDDDVDRDEEEHDHDDKKGSHDYVVKEVEDDDKEVEDLDDKGEEDTHAKTATPTNLPLLLDREWESSDSR
ncbi:phosphopantothenoylcysteine decarboxylase subunit VHS3-like [Neltuma alba]|uniref:phosphopantothenoylcysteine decarboxylase subunit VHS3-like n=1 Tax=Neltuma alba TaxID=207710 RepID=UPI0010A4FBFD|nr:phosphopantothenoylcysteine decarboxylase subunit VHS3-like [Prosopis alba]